MSSTVDILAERGIAAVTVDAVATAAGVNPTTIYRRWPTVQVLIMEALSDRSAVAIPVPDTGILDGDLRAILEDVRAYISSPVGRALVNATIGSAGGAEVAAFRQDFWDQRFSLVGEVVRRAAARGEVTAGIDSRFMIETAIAALYFRVFVVGGDVDDELVDRVVQLVINGAANA